MNRRLMATSDPGTTPPTRFMPAASSTSPIAPRATVSANSSVRLLDNLADSSMRRRSAVLPHELQPFRAESQKRHGFLKEARALVAIPERVANDAPDDPRTEVVRVVEPVDGRHHFGAAQIRICHVRKLVTGAVRQRLAGQKASAVHVLVELGAGVGVRQRDL